MNWEASSSNFALGKSGIFLLQQNGNCMVLLLFIFSGIIYFKVHKNIYRAFMSSFVIFISRTYFPQLGTSTLNSTFTGLCGKNLCGSGRAIQSNRGTKSSSYQSSTGDLHAPALENTLFKYKASLKNGKAIPTTYFFTVLTLLAFVFATHMSPQLFPKKDLLVKGSKPRAHNLESYV